MPDHHRILRMPDIQERMGGISRSTVYRWIRDGWLPEPKKLGKNTVGWLERDFNHWLESVYDTH